MRGYAKNMLLWFMSLWGLGGALVIALTFYTAYFDPTGSVIISVDGRGEADFEAFLYVPLFLSFSAALTVWLLADFVRDLRRGKKHEASDRF